MQTSFARFLEGLLAIRPGGAKPRMPLPSEIGAEVLAGVVASLVTLAHCLSFSALIFAGDLRDGLAFGLWGFLAATAVANITAAVTSTMPPAFAGPRNPVVAVMSVLATLIAADVMAAGGSRPAALRHVLLAFSLAGLLTGLVLWLLGRFRLGQLVRFVPYPVIAGFLAASGLLLIVGGLGLAVGQPLRPVAPGAFFAALTPDAVARLAVAIVFALVVSGLRRLGVGPTALPHLFLSTAVVLDLALWWAGLRSGWYLDGTAGARFWSPLGAPVAGSIELAVLLRASVEILTIVAVSAFVLPLELSSLEVQRRADADMDAEFRSSGLTGMALAPLGGLPVGLAPNASRLADTLGATSRLAGLAAGLFFGLVLLTGLDLAALVPTPVLAGLVIAVGITALGEALAGQAVGLSRIETGLALVIMLAIVRFGYLTGVILGLIGACLLFAGHYSRIDVIRRHVTRADFASGVERAPDEQARLIAEGQRIHVLWLNGFIFFGSAHRIGETIRGLFEAETAAGSIAAEPPEPPDPAGPRRWLVLDLAGVSGIDATAIVSLTKLRQWAEARRLTLVLAAPAATLGRGRRLPDFQGLRVFPNRSDALEWCEEALLAEGQGDVAASKGPDAAAFETWLGAALGQTAGESLMARYLERQDFGVGEVVCRQGKPSDTILFVAAGSVSVEFVDGQGREVSLRRMTLCTVIGEMGFFRDTARAATVAADCATTIYVLRRERYEALMAENPAVGRALIEFVVRALADRLDFANRERAALV